MCRQWALEFPPIQSLRLPGESSPPLSPYLGRFCDEPPSGRLKALAPAGECFQDSPDGSRAKEELPLISARTKQPTAAPKKKSSMDKKREEREREFFRSVCRSDLLAVGSFVSTPDGFNVNCLNAHGRPATHVAARNGNVYLLDLLVQHGAMLGVAHGADSSFAHGERGDSEADLAAWNGHVDVLQWLVGNMNLDVNKADRFGNTLAHIAARR